MKKTLITFAVLGQALCLQAATTFEVSLTADGSSATVGPGASFQIEATLDDPFTYNPTNPTATNPNLGSNTSVSGFHGNSDPTHFIRYTFGPMTTTASLNDFAFDLWGRNNVNTERDDNFTVALYNGSYTTAILTSPNTSIDDITAGGDEHVRVSFNDIAAGTTFDRVEVRAVNTPAFTIQEVRAATDIIPEPSTSALAGLAGLGLILRRRR